MSAHYEREIGLHGAKLLKERNRNIVVRARIAPYVAGTPDGVIIKQLKAPGPTGYNDWAGIKYVSELGARPALAPRFVAGDHAHGLFIMEDLGPGPLLGGMLDAPDAGAAAGALIGLARAVGRLHAATLGGEPAYHGLRETLAPDATPHRLEQATAFREMQRKLQPVFDRLSVRRHPGLAREWASIAGQLADPGPFLTFTHGDLSPTNAHCGGPSLRLLDFEYGGFRHALYDVIFWRIICPFPQGIVQLMDTAYRAVVSPACPQMADDERFARALSALAAYDMLRNLSWHLAPCLTEDRPWAPGLSARPALLHKLQAFVDIAVPTRSLPALVDAAQHLRARLSKDWPEAAAHSFGWPAFGGPQKDNPSGG